MDQVTVVLLAHEQVLEQSLVKCGLEAKGISIKYDEDLQSIDVVIAPAARAVRGQFGCIRDAVAHDLVTFEDGATDKAYNDYLAKETSPQILASLMATLRERNLLERFPERGSFESLSEFAKALEKHAGIKPGAALRVDGDSIVFDPPHKPPRPADSVAMYSDLLGVLMYASVHDHVSVGFVGNEATLPDR